MKIKTRSMTYEEVMALPRPEHKKPKRPSIFFRTLLRVASQIDLWKSGFTYTGKMPDEEPCLILMNHSSFIDLEIVQKITFPRPVGIVSTSDGFVGKYWLMRQIGCFPTRKFVSDISLISDIKYLLKEKKTSVLMYPEASYSFDGTATPLPRKLGVLLKKLDVPVVHIQTYGAFTRNPLYNCLQKRKVKVSAEVKCLLTRGQIKEKSVEEIDAVLDEAFSFDQFKWQYENGIKTEEPFIADGLERILYRCANCGAEGKTVGKGRSFECTACGKKYTIDDYGRLSAEDGETEFSHIPDWYAAQRRNVREEIINGEYGFDVPVKIGMMVDYKAIYMVGDGVLHHDANGFNLTGCDGKLNYTQSSKASYSLYSDYYWYEIGDVICIGNNEVLYYCFPPKEFPVAKARLAAEEIYKLLRRGKAQSAAAKK